jgi:hypothetical protein
VSTQARNRHRRSRAMRARQHNSSRQTVGMHKLIRLTGPNSFLEIAAVLQRDYQPTAVVDFLNRTLSDSVEALLLEFLYIDKDYRSTYYNFYAKKGLRYDPFCVRIHCFRHSPVLGNDLVLMHAKGHGYEQQLNDEYLGFIVVRPLPRTPIGRTLLDPRAIRGFTGNVIRSNNVVHVLGRRVQVRAYPYMQQHTDISVCAHVACWSVLRHYSQRFPQHAEYLTHDITMMASPDDPGGLVPSRGLQIENARSIFSRGGTYPDMYVRERKKSDADFFRSLFSYVASGFPVFAAMSKKGHAITVIGYGMEESRRPSLIPDQGRFRYVWDYSTKLVVMDDNHAPYRTIGLNRSADIDYAIRDIDAFIVALPEKIYLSAEAVREHIQNLLLRPGVFDFPKPNQIVIRTLLTTSSAFKSHLVQHRSELSQTFFMACMELSMPQFIWIAELCDPNWRKSRTCNLRLILDATANAKEPVPYFVVQDKNKAMTYDRGVSRELGVIDLRRRAPTPLSLYTSNVDSFH